MRIRSFNPEIEIISECHLEKHNFNQHLRFRAVQALNDVLHLQVRVFIRDDDHFARLWIDGNHRFTDIRAARVLTGAAARPGKAAGRGAPGRSSSLPLLRENLSRAQQEKDSESSENKTWAWYYVRHDAWFN
jgi:hypothetical protein